MRPDQLISLLPLLIAALLSGCASSDKMQFTEFDDATGRLMATENVTSGRFKERVERFTNGRIRAEDWTSGDSRVRLEFYESGGLKSEERFAESAVTFARYYTVAGALERKIGDDPLPAKRH